MMLDEQGRELLALLVARLPTVRPNDPRTFVTYKQVHELLGLRQLRQTYGESLKIQGLTSLADWTAEMRHPAITGLIVAESDHQPGDGYFRLFGKEEDYVWWREQIQLSREYDWSPFLSLTERDFSFVEVSDIETPPSRVEVTVVRIVRDTKVAQAVKRAHNFQCQICDSTIELPNGQRYAEAHHIKPLGGKHKGLDKQGNVMCLCPNHHAQLDLGAIPIDPTMLRTANGHQLDQASIDYHNETIYLGS